MALVLREILARDDLLSLLRVCGSPPPPTWHEPTLLSMRSSPRFDRLVNPFASLPPSEDDAHGSPCKR